MRKPISTGVVASMIKALAPKADPAVIAQAVDDYLDAHPEISVADGSITEEKLAQDVLNQLGEIDTVKNALNTVSDFVGDENTDIGTHVITEEKLSFSNSSVISRDVTIKKTTDNLLEVSGTASSTFLETIQNNIALPAGSYTFTIDNPVQSPGYQIQLHNIDADSVMQSFTSNATNQFYNFTLNSATNVRIRILVTSGSVVSDSQKVSLYSRTTIDNTIAFATKKLNEDISFITDKVKQKCGLIESVGTILTADKLTITGTNVKVKSDNSTVFSTVAKRITALADSATVKFAFGGATYDISTFTLVFYLPFNSYTSASGTSVELRIYGNGSTNTPFVSASNCCWGWNYLKIPKSKTGMGQSEKLSSVDIVFKHTNGTTETEFGEIIVDSIILDMKMKPTFILDFDQIWAKSIENGAYEYCRTNNIPYTIHAYQFDNRDSDWIAEMNKAMMYGCEFSYYGGYTNENYMQNVASYSDAVAECLLMENDIIPFTSKRFLTYGCGAHVMNKFLRESLEASGVKAIRGRWIQNPIGYFCDKSTWLPYSIEISYGNSTIEQIKAQIDEAIANGSCVVAFTHGVCNDDESVLGVSSSAIRLTTFKAMIDYLADLRNHGKIQICTMEQFVNQCIG